MKRILAFLLCSILLFCFTACDKNTGIESVDPPTQPTDAPIPSWKTAYLDYLEKEKDAHLSYALVYIDNDDVPELYLSGNCEAQGDRICAFKNGTVIALQLNRIGGGRYIERSGNIINQNGNMGQIYTHVYKFDKGAFGLVFQALSVERIETLGEDEYISHYEYSVADEPVDEAEYQAAVEAAFDFENAVQLNENEVSYDRIVQQIMDHI